MYVLSRKMKNIRIFLSENFHFLVVKFSVYLNRHVFVLEIFYSMTSMRINQCCFYLQQAESSIDL